CSSDLGRPAAPAAQARGGHHGRDRAPRAGAAHGVRHRTAPVLADAARRAGVGDDADQAPLDEPLRSTRPSRASTARAAAATASPWRAPGWGPIRSIGPEIEVAATMAPSAARTAADTEATPGSRSATLSTQAAPSARPARTWAAEPTSRGST